MTYFLAAPLLYKEPIIGDFESLFLGVDAAMDAESQTATKDPNDRSVSLVHKRDLFKLVEGVHIVYSPLDATFYQHAQPNALDLKDSTFDDAMEDVDTSRHLNVPGLVNDLSLAQLFPNLRRSTVGLWCRNGWDGTAYDFNTGHDERDAGDFESDLTDSMYQFTPGTICRTPWDGGLWRTYPARRGDITLSILHEAFEGRIEGSLFPSAKHFIHDDIEIELDRFHHHLLWLYRTMVEKMREWVDDPEVSHASVQSTEITFVIHHVFKSNYDKGEAAMRQWRKDIQAHEQWLRSYIALHDPYPEETSALDGWDKWKLIPEEEYPACPACQPEEYKKFEAQRSAFATVTPVAST